MNNDQFRDLTREFLQNLGGGLPEEGASPPGVLTEQGGAIPARAVVGMDPFTLSLRVKWGELLEVLVGAAKQARTFNRLNASEGPGGAYADQTGFGGTEANELSDLLQDVWEGAGFHADELFKGHR